MQQIDEEIRRLGGRIYFIGPETEENALALMEKSRATIPLLYDRDGAVMEAYRLAFEVPEGLRPGFEEDDLTLPQLNPQTGWKLPIPATFVVDGDQRIRARHVNADYTRRMEPADIVAAVRALREG